MVDVAVIAGYANENIIRILSKDFSYVALIATYTIFDGFKRERTYKMRKAQEGNGLHGSRGGEGQGLGESQNQLLKDG
jgi:hypothetical protein